MTKSELRKYPTSQFGKRPTKSACEGDCSSSAKMSTKGAVGVGKRKREDGDEQDDANEQTDTIKKVKLWLETQCDKWKSLSLATSDSDSSLTDTTASSGLAANHTHGVPDSPPVGGKRSNRVKPGPRQATTSLTRFPVSESKFPLSEYNRCGPRRNMFNQTSLARNVNVTPTDPMLLHVGRPVRSVEDFTRNTVNLATAPCNCASCTLATAPCNCASCKMKPPAAAQANFACAPPSSHPKKSRNVSPNCRPNSRNVSSPNCRPNSRNVPTNFEYSRNIPTNAQPPQSNFRRSQQNVRSGPSGNNTACGSNTNACGSNTNACGSNTNACGSKNTYACGDRPIPLPDISFPACQNEEPVQRSYCSNMFCNCINCLSKPASASLGGSSDGRMTATFSPECCHLCKSPARPVTRIIAPNECHMNNLNVPSQCSTCGNERPYLQGEFVLDYMGYTLVKVKYFIPKNGIENALTNA